MPSLSHTLAAGSVNLILAASQLPSEAVQTALGRADISPALLRDPDGRIPLAQLQTLWHELITLSGDPYLPLQLGARSNPLAMGALAYVLLSCPTIGEVLAQLILYEDVACQGVRIRQEVAGQQVVLTFTIESAEIRYPRYVLESELSVVAAALRALTGQAVPLQEARFSFPQPADIEVYHTVFAPAHLVFDAPVSALVLPAEYVSTPVLNANPALLGFFQERATRLLQALSPDPQVSDRLRHVLANDFLGRTPTLSEAADRLHMSTRNLQLHLRNEGTTFQRLIDEARCRIACNHLAEPYLSVTDLAYLLGFSEAGAFVRAFRKWTGKTPGEYREERK